MKKILIWILVFFIFLGNTFASYSILDFKFDDKDKREITRELAFVFLTELTLKELPSSYKYINLNFTDVKKDEKIYDSLQKLVYVDLLKNNNGPINKHKKINSYYFYLIFQKLSWIEILDKKTIGVLKNRNLMLWDLKLVKDIYNNFIHNDKSVEVEYKYNLDNFELADVNDENYLKFQILMDVYRTLLTWHYYNKSFSSSDLVYWAISWMAEATWDQFTTFFPPANNKDFYESLSWEFEWIWAYVEMEKPWILKIISPISWSPAEKAWLKWWDIIIKVEWKEITPKMTINQAVRLIKWPAWTKVVLTILRDEKQFDIEVIRDKITIKDVEYSILNDRFHYIKIRMFGEKVLNEFNKSIEEIKNNPNIKNIIIDLRNNPGGYLESVTSILNNFVPKWATTAVVKYKEWNKEYISNSDNILDINNYNVYILINSWSASASEIMVWTLKDYFPNIKVIWEKSYWKWSVQTIRSYVDWSSLKYTIANWYTWKTQKTIDKVWIKPDIEVILDTEKFKTWFDNQLDYILKNF